jgi:hypothetical protein
MTMVEITLRDDYGNLIESQARRIYPLELGDESFNAIEAAVGTLKNSALPDLKADLLKNAQLAFIKKRSINPKWEKSGDDQNARRGF